MGNTPKLRFEGFDVDWEHHKVGDFYDFKNGINKCKEFFGEGTPIVNYTDVFHNRGLFFSSLKGKVSLTPDEISNYEVKQGDLFFTRTSETIDEIGYPSVMLDRPEETVFSGFILRGRSIQPKDPLDELFKKYVFFTRAFRNEMIQKSSMTTRALTSGSSIKDMVFSHPTIKTEQRMIGEYLTCIENFISLQQRKLDAITGAKQFYLQTMFPQNGERKPRLRFAGIEENWKRRKISEITSTAPFKPYLREASKEGKFKVIQQGDIPVLGYADGWPYMDYENVTLFGDHTLSLYKPKSPFFIATDGLKIIYSDGMDGYFLYYLLEKYKPKSEGYKRHYSVLKECECFYPSSTKEQQYIGRYFDEIDNLISLQQSIIAAFQNIKQFFLQNMFV